MHGIGRSRDVRPKRALEVGGYVGEKSLLRSPEIAGAERWCINLVEHPSGTGIEHVVGSGNDMHMFEDASFDLLMCNACSSTTGSSGCQSPRCGGSSPPAACL